ncbi:hypothetical protein ACQEVY_14765 [Streptomyces sp. CA-288835]|uniref:hypothetical protein n=1 Tax=Streptomyces sp. CA-288835 TaxID=3240069 RepID=UPI003D8A62C8
MKSEDTPFVGGPLDGRVLPVLLGMTGHPPKVYRVPVPNAAGGPPTDLVYRRMPAAAQGRKLALHPGWKYEFDPEGNKGGKGSKLKWPWSKPETRPDTAPDATPHTKPRATPSTKPDTADE